MSIDDKAAIEDLLTRFAVGLATPVEVEEAIQRLQTKANAEDVLSRLGSKDLLLRTLRSLSEGTPPRLTDFDSTVEKLCQDLVDSVEQLPNETTNRSAEWLLPNRLDHFRIIGMLGSGGMGIVCEAIDERLERRVAIKIMRADRAQDSQHQQRFDREAKVLARLDHPSIVPLLAAGESANLSYLVMPLLQGHSLANYLTKCSLNAQQLKQLTIDLASGLQAAHSAGIIHRDIKPSNVWLEQSGDDQSKDDQWSRARLLDFGLATQTECEVNLTQSNQLLGTPAYMSPEQMQGGTLDERSDIYALGCVLYEAATGQRPFTGKTLYELLTSMLVSEPKPVEELRGDLPKPLLMLINSMIARRPENRPQSALAVIQKLSDLEVDRPKLLPQLSRRTLVSVVCATAIVIIGMAALFNHRESGENLLPLPSDAHSSKASDVGFEEKDGSRGSPSRETGIINRQRLQLYRTIRTPDPGGLALVNGGLDLYVMQQSWVTDHAEEEIWMYTRSAIDQPFRNPKKIFTGPAHSSRDLSLTDDGLTLVLSPNFDHRREGIYYANRQSKQDVFGDVQHWPEVCPLPNTYGCSISGDGLQLVFAAGENERSRPHSIWVTTRNDRSAEWQTPDCLILKNLPFEYYNLAQPVLSTDKLRLTFESNEFWPLQYCVVASRKTIQDDFTDYTLMTHQGRPELMRSVSIEPATGLIAYLSPTVPLTEQLFEIWTGQLAVPVPRTTPAESLSKRRLDLQLHSILDRYIVDAPLKIDNLECQEDGRIIQDGIAIGTWQQYKGPLYPASANMYEMTFQSPLQFNTYCTFVDSERLVGGDGGTLTGFSTPMSPQPRQ